MRRLSLCFIIAATLALPKAQATGLSCEMVFSQPSPIEPINSGWEGPPKGFEPYKNELSAELLSKYGFRIKDQHLEMRKTDGKWLDLGLLKVARPKYLFEWAHKDLYNYLVKNGIGPEYMKNILSHSGQTSGKGFYVSMHPTDSSRYGDAVTTFHPTKPLVILQYIARDHRFNSDTEFVSRLAEIGIDGLRNGPNYTESWISMIHHRNLQSSSEIPLEVLEWIFESRKTSRAWDVLPEFISEKYLSHFPMGDNATASTIRKVLDSETIEDLRPALKQIYSLNHRGLNFLQKSFAVKNDAPPREKIYDSVLSLFDFRDIFYAHKKTQGQWGPFMNYMKREANSYLEKKQKVNLKRISTIEGLQKAYETLFGQRAELRGGSIGMSEEGSPVLTLPKEVADRLRSLSFLRLTYEPKQPRNENLKRVRVNYWYMNSNDLSYVFYNKLVPEKIYREGKEKYISHDGSIDSKNKEIQTINKILLKNHAEELVKNDPVNFDDLLNSYRNFVGYHPFSNGNGRMSRLLFEILSARAKFPASTKPVGGLTLPIFDLDLFAPEEKLPLYMNLGAALRHWVRKAKNDAEFISRSLEAYQALHELEPELNDIFHDFK